MFFRLFAALVAVCFSTAALAAGPYDGIYNVPGTKEYLSVHQNGSWMIVGNFSTIPASNIVYYLGDGQQTMPTRMDKWDLFSGTISGNSVTLVGEIAYGACSSQTGAVFNSSGVTVTQQYISTTALGIAQGVNCPGYQQYFVNVLGLSRYWVKVL